MAGPSQSSKPIRRKPRVPDPVEARPREAIPQEIIQDVLAAIRSACYASNDVAPKQWYQDRVFLLQRVVLWPAGWLHKRGVSLPPARYKEILLGIIKDIRIHGQASTVKYWPGYLAKCVQDHFKHNEDNLYNEAKAFRAVLERTLGIAKLAAVPQTPSSLDPVRQLEELRRLCIVPKRRRPQLPPTGKQLSLF